MTTVIHPLASACTLLFVPGSRPERLSKALASGAGGVIVDWEDAVAPVDKAAARTALQAALVQLAPAERARLAVRINAAGTPWHAADLVSLAALAGDGLRVAVLPKAEGASGVAEVARVLGVEGRVLPLVESVAGLDAVREIAHAQQVLRLVFGHLDFQADAGLACGPGEEELVPVRLQIVLATRAAGLPAPVDGVTPDTKDMALVQAHAARAVRGGFGGKLCIHPAQVAAVHAAFTPPPEKIDWARRVVAGFEATGGSVFELDGRMVDLPVLKLAERMLLHAGLAGRREVSGGR